MPQPLTTFLEAAEDLLTINAFIPIELPGSGLDQLDDPINGSISTWLLFERVRVGRR